ncbi:MAG: Mov34/MPN/PAD-1 family protein [Cyanobacteria bacterium REEB65]|nr:Mov34/MPN/PAD-1 family protein [Cyanobacteria bacterium REEB65]
MSEIRWQDDDPPAQLPLVSWEAFRRERSLAGERPVGKVAVFMTSIAAAAMRAHGEASQGTEVGGILYGRVQDLDGGGGRVPLVDILAALPAEGAAGTSVHLRWTAEAWANIFSQRADLAPDLEIVGWYHTHPGLGVFLSGTDRQTHSAFFSQPWQVAIVLDPHDGELGVFAGEDGKAVPLTLYGPAIARGRSVGAMLLVASGALAFGLFLLGVSETVRRRRGSAVR